MDNKDAKLSDRLYANSLDLRGFESRGVGPVDNGDHIGGNNLAILSVKSTFPNPIPESLKANTFTCSTNWRESFVIATTFRSW